MRIPSGEMSAVVPGACGRLRLGQGEVRPRSWAWSPTLCRGSQLPRAPSAPQGPAIVMPHPLHRSWRDSGTQSSPCAAQVGDSSHLLAAISSGLTREPLPISGASPRAFRPLGTTQGTPLHGQPRTAGLSGHPQSSPFSLPSTAGEQGGSTPSPWVGNDAALCQPNQQHRSPRFRDWFQLKLCYYLIKIY